MNYANKYTNLQSNDWVTVLGTILKIETKQSTRLEFTHHIIFRSASWIFIDHIKKIVSLIQPSHFYEFFFFFWKMYKNISEYHNLRYYNWVSFFQRTV